MSRAHQAARHAEREEERLSRAYTNGEISGADYNAQMREVQREMRDAYEADREEALEAVRHDWGAW